MRKIAICNQKGGVAKTTSAINIASYLALKGKKTLLIDLDPQANATSGVGVDKRTIQHSIYNVLHEHINIEQAIRDTEIEYLSVIPSNINLTGAEVELVNVMGREYRLKKALNEMKVPFDYVIIDCPPSLGLLTINGLTATDSIIIPIQCEYYALEGLAQLMNTVKLIRDNLNDRLQVEGVLLTMADQRTKLTKEVIGEVQKFFGNKVYKTIIPRTIKLTEAPGFGKPIPLYDPTSLGAKKYEDVTNEILGIYSESKNEETTEDTGKTEEQHGKEVGERA
ncbi:MAG: AAA family ATPase [Candidatus Omnitrophica bacterium]|jgi:chromosome partitioning protein|nr:AAA family ATPase [Candidatus Omnitrophota bacterium]MDD4012759.1 AAA family ATPase [Candidatus Omnitrophota bacterium]